MIITSKLKIDLQQSNWPSNIYAVQGDQFTREVAVALYSCGQPWKVPDGVTVAVRYCKPDKTKGYYDTMPDNSVAYRISDNVVTVLLAPQMLTVAGTVTAQVELLLGSKLLSTFSFRVCVEKNPAAGVLTSENYINWLNWMESELTERMNKMLESGAFQGPQGPQGESGDPAVLLSTEVRYQVGDSGEIIPSGSWQADIPFVPQGRFLWSRTVRTFNTGSPETIYGVSRMGVDGTGAVSSVAGVSPDPDGNVPLTASDVGALPTAGGTMEGPVNMNGQKITGLNAPTEDTDVANKKYVDDTFLKKSGDTMTGPLNVVMPTEGTHAVPKSYADSLIAINHLHNSDFEHFIAQAGIGGNHGTQAYAGDRWILDSGTVTGTANANGDGYSNIRLNGTIRQKVANPPTGEYSAFVEMVSGTAEISYADGAVTITSNGGVIKNADLYPAVYTKENKPPNVPKGYGAELVECQRYYERIGDSQSNALCNSTFVDAQTTGVALCVTYAKKRMVGPTVTLSAASNYRILIFEKTSGTAIGAQSVTNIASVGSTYDSAIISVKFANPEPQNAYAVLQRQDNAPAAYIDVSADL